MEFSTPETTSRCPSNAEFALALLLSVAGIYVACGGMYYTENKLTALLFVVFYVLKTTIALQARLGRASSAWAYLGLLFCIVVCTLIVRGEIIDGGILVYYTMALFLVPTIMFLYDVFERPRPRTVLWRTVVEMVVLFPLWYLFPGAVIYFIEVIMGIHI